MGSTTRCTLSWSLILLSLLWPASPGSPCGGGGLGTARRSRRVFGSPLTIAALGLSGHLQNSIEVRWLDAGAAGGVRRLTGKGTGVAGSAGGTARACWGG